MDKFLTDLAAHTDCNTVTVEWRGFCGPDRRFEVRLFADNASAEYGCDLHRGEGPTVAAAMLAAVAAKRSHDEREAA